MRALPAACDLEVAAAVPAGSAAEVEAQAQQPPAAKVDPRLRSVRCAFVRKLYGILSLQFVLTAAVAVTAFILRRPIPRFFADGPAAVVWPMFVVILVSPLIAMFPMLDYSEKKRPRNIALLALFTLCCSFSIAVPVSGFTTVEMAFLQVTILTVLGVTPYAIWSAKRDYDYDYMDAFARLLVCVVFMSVCAIVVIPFPLKILGIAIGGFLVALVFSGVFVAAMARNDHGNDYNGDGCDDDDEAAPPAGMKLNNGSGSLGVQRV